MTHGWVGDLTSPGERRGSGVAARRAALGVLARVEDDGAYANLALRAALDRSELDQVDRNLVTDLVAGTIRRRRSVDALVDRFLDSPPPPAARRALRLGAYQLVYRDDLPDYAVVSTTVEASPSRFRGLVNAVLRRVAAAPVEFSSPAEELSYPDWILDRLEEDLGVDVARAALAAMDEAPRVHRRDDGYTQDLASQWVAAAVGAGPGELVLDLCAAPGGKATAIAGSGATVVAAEVNWSRVGLVVTAARTVGLDRTLVVAADGLRPPFRPGVFDRVLVDAPCSGLGVLGRRSDARWRLDEAAPERLAELQSALVGAAADLVRPGGSLVYSVCTLTAVESVGVDEWTARSRPDLVPLEPPGEPWTPVGRGALLLPQTAGSDGMALFRYRRSA
jgi:16S rRNA (cytosine967-C5)-methyltransferase